MPPRQSAATRPRPGHAILDLGRSDRLRLVLVVTLGLIGAAANLAVPLLVRELISAVAEHRDVTGVVLAMAGLALSALVVTATATWLLQQTGERLILRVRCQVMDHILRLPLDVVRSHGAGALGTRLTTDAAHLRSLVDVGFAQLPVAAATAIATVTVMAVLSPTVTVVALLTLGPGAMFVRVATRKLRQRFQDLQQSTSALGQHVTATASALTTIKACVAEPRAAADFAEKATHLSVRTLSVARLQSMVTPVMALGNQVSMIAVVIVGGAQVSAGALPVSTFIAVLLCLFQLTVPLGVLEAGISRIQIGRAARRRFAELLATPAERAAPAAPETPLSDGGTAVEFRDVWFDYHGHPALRRVCLAVPGRGLTAIIGHSGAGKSTVLKLIERFIEPTRGTIHVLGRDIGNWPLHSLRRNVTYVDQEFTLLEGPIRLNLTLGLDPGLAEQRLWTALATVGLEQDIRRLPDGLDTHLGRNHDLSGGQRQRLALARALIRDTPLVVLDEPTSQMDTTNEAHLLRAMDALATDRAVLVVAHRLSTIQNATHVLVLEQGRVVGSGTHAELSLSCQHYRELLVGHRECAAALAPHRSRTDPAAVAGSTAVGRLVP
ncbi:MULTISPECIES: ABC transporter ATP-binding protein [unclassified Crossiella]|uniref:ABC transporter ATP-binding protein n=1 Tax=unclassified Crossiella TaxID=2620835 RepID=UPI001FFF9F03|nr:MULTISPECIES: ABC transporter ATP-binding protein [unclassified Crossiella]MCK2244383.1 ABC transporter ATP-binding protein/permease [Crossiella sp. S99.2]MCK2257789.1 ABC transporter ATP-binding protein/permease [Crossiella sp. S99.1]